MVEFDFHALWQGRVDSEEAPALATRLHQRIRPLPAALSHEASQEASQEAPGIAVVGFCCDEGVRRNQGRTGAVAAPDQLRRALANLPVSADLCVYDAGNIGCDASELEAAQQALGLRVADCLARGHRPLVLGGGHEVAYGSWLGLHRHLRNNADPGRIGIINFDAHFDLRADTQGASSGTPFYQIARACEAAGEPFHYCCLGVSEASNTAALFQRADELGVSYRRDSEMGLHQLAEIQAQLQRFMADCDYLYLTIDLDVLPAAVAPGVSAPAAYGVGLAVLEPLIGTIRQSGKLQLADIAEYNPTFDIDHWTARVAARLSHCIVK